MKKKIIFIFITLIVIESFFVSTLSANNMILKIKDNNLFHNNKNFSNKPIFHTEKIYYSSLKDNADYTFEYLIITSEDYVDSKFQVLIDHKSNYLNATMVTIEDVISNSSFWVNGSYGDATNNSNGNHYIIDGEEVTFNYNLFNDTAAKIRNFIRFAHQNWKTEYVLLGGDVEIIPVRKFYVNLSGWEAGLLFDRRIQSRIPSDLYYGNLDGTWNKDFDDKFGEIGNTITEDEADFLSEVFVGRAPIDGFHDIATFVDKVINFETTNKPKNIFLHQSNLSSDGGPDTSIITEECAKYIPESFMIDRLYQKNEAVSIDKWIKSFKNPDKLIHLQIGNGYYYGPTESWYRLNFTKNKQGNIVFSNNDIGYLDNKFFPIHISISCLNGNFENSDCLAEELLLWSKGGPSACFFNSDVGCVQENNSLKYSGEYIVQLFYEIFINKTQNLGKINQFSKYNFINDSYTNPNYRFVIYETNLLGDPETPVFETRIKLQNQMIFVDNDFNNSTPDWNITCFNKIQNGINACSDFGIVFVYNGTYVENIVIDKTIILIGESKHSTIIDGGDIESTVVIQSNSSTITNFTILHNNSNKNNKELIGLYIPNGCWGNTITNNIILRNSKCGIFIEDSCRNFIYGNIIKLNAGGISLVKKINRFFEKRIIITCTNKIEYNDIYSNEEYGIYIQNNLNNYICCNNFINNNGGSGRDAFFILSRNNVWNGNYWNEPRTEPKNILGIFGPLYPKIIDFSHGWIFPEFKYLLIINFGFPIHAVDKNPTQIPYDIF
jgi:parallel beta-helix repeat protein